MGQRILGIDPGSRLTGYGIVHRDGQKLKVVVHGTLRLPVEEDVTMPQRLFELYRGLKQIIAEHRPTILAIEKVFVAKNALSALKLGQARGVVLALGAEMGLQIFEYTPTQVKGALTGHGHAPKDQVARVVQMVLRPRQVRSESLEFETADASDALSIALAHALLTRQLTRLEI